VKAPSLGAVVALAGLILAGTAAAQVPTNRARAYLLPTDVTDTRALWVNPAGLAVRPEASILLDLMVLDPGSTGRLGQASIGLNARGLSFGYQWDRFSSGTHGHSFRLGLGASSGRLAAGAAVAFHGGAIHGTGWDVGLRYDWRQALTFGGTVRDLGRPRANGVREDVTFVPAITVRPLGAWLAVSGDGRLTTSKVQGYDVQASLQLPGRPAFGVIAQLDTDRAGRRTAFTLALSLGRRDRLGLTGSTPGDFSRLGTASLYGLSTRTPVR
jgi:hypothetical protein